MIPEFVPFPELPDVLLIKPHRFEDSRGYLCESYNQRAYESGGVFAQFVQDNYSRSTQRGTLRGLHFQLPPHAQDKLVRCVRGSIFDVAVDIRSGSPTFGKWVAEKLTGDNTWQMYIPAGFAHGFLTLESDTEVAYKLSGHYDGPSAKSIRFDDPHIGIDWPISADELILSDKDLGASPLSELSSSFTYKSA